MCEFNFSADCAFKQLDAAGGVINPFIIFVSHVWESLLWLLLDKRMELLSGSRTYISRVPQVWSTGSTLIFTPFVTSSVRSASTSSTRKFTPPPDTQSPEK